jgi:uncharacterized protein (UPF0332 family)
MPRTREGEIAANLERAEASIQAAKQLTEGGSYDSVVSRIYYAVFYASTAMLLCEALEFSEHSGVISAIHRDFGRTGKLDEQYGKDLNWSFELRGTGDYGAMVHVSQQDAERAISRAEEFLHAVRDLLKCSQGP